MPVQTIITDTQVRVEFTPSVLNAPLPNVAGILGFEMMERMYWDRWEPYLPDYRPIWEYDFPHSRWDMESLAKLVGMGFVQTTRIGDGFVLTADGHYHIARHLKRELDEHRFWEHQRRLHS